MQSVPVPLPASTADSLSVVIPAFNEAGNLDSLIEAALPVVAGLVGDFEIIIVDDGSRDGTAEIVDRLAAGRPHVRGLHHPDNRGYGAAVRTGILAARHSWVVLLPADHQFDLRDLGRMLAGREQADFVCGCRRDRKDTRRRQLVSWVFNSYVGRVYDLHCPDLNWVKLFRRESFLQLPSIDSAGFCFDVEMLLRARAGGCRIINVPVEHHARTWGEPTPISLSNVLRTLRELARIRRTVGPPQRAVGAA